MRLVSPEKRNEVHDLWQLVIEKREASRALLSSRFFNDSLSRAYYSAFHAVTLLFLLYDQAFSSHKQIIGMFNKEFVHTNVFPERIARDLESLFESRQTGDYDYHISFDQKEAEEGLEKLTCILEVIREHVSTEFGVELRPIP